MTAEIAILNRGAVALAADSAVTITTPTGPKIYESVNKLFHLIKNRPLGAMIFDSADLIGVPWETVIKAYRMDRETFEASSLREYALDLLKYMETKPELLGDALQVRFLKSTVEARLRAIRNDVDAAVRDALTQGTRRALGKAKVVALLEAALGAWEATVAAMPTPPWAIGLAPGVFSQRHQPLIDSTIDEVFQQLPLGVRRRKRLAAMVVDWLAKDASFEPRSGLVLAGFGADEYFPSLLRYEVTGLLEGRLRYRLVDDLSIDPDRYAVIAPFAQRDVVDSFITGLSSRLDDVLMDFIRQVLENGFPEIATHVMGGLHPGVPLDPALRGRLGDAGQQLVGQLEQVLGGLKGEAAQPIVESVGFLPKDELAAMAESLVNLTSLRRRVSISEAQTVGGPVDVAVISRGDGFVWIKRKHYFDRTLNPTWSMTHAGNRP